MLFYRVNKRGLDTNPRSKALIQRTMVIIAPCTHLPDYIIMDPEECLQLAFPAFCFGMAGIPFFPLCQYIPDGMKFVMFTQQMITAQFIRRYIPYSHCTLFSLMTYAGSKIFIVLVKELPDILPCIIYVHPALLFYSIIFF